MRGINLEEEKKLSPHPGRLGASWLKGWSRGRGLPPLGHHCVIPSSGEPAHRGHREAFTAPQVTGDTEQLLKVLHGLTF